MHYYLIAPTSIVRHDQDKFTYHSEKRFDVGTIVRISIGRHITTGVIVDTTEKPPFDTKAIDSIVIDTPLPGPLVQLRV